MKVLVVGGPASEAQNPPLVRRVATAIGRTLHRAGHQVIVCSTHPDSADVRVLEGVVDAATPDQVDAIAYLPEHAMVKDWTRDVERKHKETLRLQPNYLSTPPLDDEDSRAYAYLTCQLIASDECQAIVVFGGRRGGSAELFLTVAGSRGKPILALRFLGGAAEDHFRRQRATYEARLGGDHRALDDEARLADACALLDRLVGVERPVDDQFFISYSRKNGDYGDVAEKILRRDGLVLYRDESHVDVGDPWREEIEKELERSSVVIVLWSVHFASSPHCFLEMQQTLDRRRKSKERFGSPVPELWVFRLDQTRMTFPGVNELGYAPCDSTKHFGEQLRIRLDTWRKRH
jgi:hypothetical protein